MKHEPSSTSSALARHEELLNEIKDLEAEVALESIFESPPDLKVRERLKAAKAEADALLPKINLG